MTPRLSARSLVFAFALEVLIVAAVFVLALAGKISGERALVAVGFVVVGRLRPPSSGGPPSGLVATLVAGTLAIGRAVTGHAREEQPAGGE